MAKIRATRFTEYLRNNRWRQPKKVFATESIESTELDRLALSSILELLAHLSPRPFATPRTLRFPLLVDSKEPRQPRDFR